MRLILKNGKYYEKKVGSGRPKEYNEASLMIELLKNGSNPSNVQEEVKNLLLSAEDDNTDSLGVDISTLKLEIIQKYDIFKNFFIVENEVSQSSVVYYKNEINTSTVCSAAAFDSKFAKPILEKYEKDNLDDFHKELARLIDPKDWTRVPVLQSLDTCLNVSKNLKTIVTSGDPHPAVIEGLDKFSLSIIPYVYHKYSFKDLNKPLQDFLERTEYHEYLCAVLWSHFIGNLLPYVIYLRGDGGDGKTSFINMLGKLTKSYSNFDGGDRFNYFNMFGKSIIGLNENESSKLMQNRVVKSITGGNSVQIEGKGKNSYSGQVRGLIIIDSNYDLELLGREDEKRRLRYFRVSPLMSQDGFIKMSQDKFLEVLGSTPNEFLNYCRECYEELEIKGSGGLIKETPNHNTIFTELTDNIQEHKFAEFYRQNISKNYVLEGKCESLEILLALEKRFPKDTYVQRNFKKYLESHYGIKPSGKYFIGLSKHDKELIEALPND